MPPTSITPADYRESFKTVYSEPILIKTGAGQNLTFEVDDSSKSRAMEEGARNSFKSHFMLESIALRPAFPLPCKGYGGNPDTTVLTDEKFSKFNKTKHINIKQK
jgi:hypothetical protein